MCLLSAFQQGTWLVPRVPMFRVAHTSQLLEGLVDLNALTSPYTTMSLLLLWDWHFPPRGI